ncbi:hypothetical protein [Cellulosilyticum ruminicola]|uniref:hypothetical protein n=1 Tax=Cellulosilyticum ruminicola TaxID=425254 RepID=UPI0012ED7507|nr:hypothetical protein [Cellulosilyticum ruminicola]
MILVLYLIANRKAKHKMNKGYRGKRADITATYENMEKAKWKEEIQENTKNKK